MKLFEEISLFPRLEAEFNSQRAIPVPRAALGLMAVLEAWVEAARGGGKQ